MTKRPNKTKSAAKARPAELQSRGMLELRNRLIAATGIMVVAGILVWKPWSHEASKTVAASAPATEVASARAQKPAGLATPLSGEAAIAPTPLYTTSAVTQVVPLPPTPPTNPRMPATLEADFDAWLIHAYRACWTPPGSTPDGDPYYPRVRVALKSTARSPGRQNSSIRLGMSPGRGMPRPQ